MNKDEIPKDNDSKKSTKEVSRDLMHLASEREAQLAAAVTPEAIMDRLDLFEASIHAYVDESVAASLRAAELAMTARISEATVTETTEKVRLMLDEDRLKRTEEYRAANDQAIRKLVEANDIQVRAMTASFAQALSQHEAKMQPRLEKVYEVGGGLDMLLTQIREYRREHDDDVRDLSDKYTQVITIVADSDTRIREGFLAHERKTTGFIQEFRVTLGTLKAIAKTAGAMVKSKAFWQFVGIGAGGGIIGILTMAIKAVVDLLF